MYADPNGYLPEWAMWVIGGVLLAGSIALTIATGGARRNNRSYDCNWSDDWWNH